MAINSGLSNNKKKAVSLLSIGLMFIILGVATGTSWLFVLSGILLILSASKIWFKDINQRDRETKD